MKTQKNILIVDDNKDIRYVTKSILNTIGNLSFYEAENGSQALDVYKNNNIDLILLDIEMPVMNGIQFLNAIFENEEIKNIGVPVIVISGLLTDDVMNKTRNRGVVKYIKKPARASILIENVKNFLCIKIL